MTECGSAAADPLFVWGNDMRIVILALLAAGIQVLAGLLGHVLYLSEWAHAAIVFCIVLEVAAAAAAVLKYRKPTVKGTLTLSEVGIWMLWTAMMTNAFALSAAVGALSEKAHAAINAVIGALLITPRLSFALCWPSTSQQHDRTRELKRKDYPNIHGILRDAADAMGHHRRLKLFWGDGTASTFVEWNWDGIILSPLFLMVLKKEELRLVFLHELAHLTDLQTRRDIRWRRLAARRAYMFPQERCRVLRLTTVPVWCAEIRFCEMLERYMEQAGPQREREADARAQNAGGAEYAAAAMAKAEFVERFMEESVSGATRLSEMKREYEATIAGKGERWLAELAAEEKSGDVHPVFAERCKAERFDPFSRETDEAWLNEMKRLGKMIDLKRKLR